RPFSYFASLRMSAVLRGLGYRVWKEEDQSGAAKMPGPWLHLSPNGLRHELTYEGGEEVRIVATSSALPWTMRRVRLVLEGYLYEIERSLAGPETAEKHRNPFQVVPAITEPGYLLALFSLFLSVLLGSLFGVLVNLVYGYGLILEVVEYLAAKVDLLEPFIPLSFPKAETLRSLPTSYQWGCGTFFALTFGYLNAFVGSMILLFGEIWRPLRRVSVWVVFIYCFALCGFAYRAESMLFNVGCAIGLPLSILLGYSLGWGMRRAAVRSNLWIKRVVEIALIAVLGIQGGIMLWERLGPAEDKKDMVWDFVEVRDRQLLNTGYGRWISEFYYTHTLYPAEVIKPLLSKSEKAVLLVTGDDERADRITGLVGNTGHVIPVQDIDKALENAKTGGADYTIIDGSVVGLSDLFSKGAKKDRTIRRMLDKSILFGEAGEFEALDLADPPPELITEPFGNKELRASVKAISDRDDPQANLRASTKWALYVGLGSLWALAKIYRLLWVLATAMLAFILGARVWKSGWPLVRTALLIVGVVFTGWQGFHEYIAEPTVAAEIEEIRAHKGDKAYQDELCVFMANPDPNVRYEAAYGIWSSLGGGRGIECIETVLDGLGDEDSRVRTWCAMTLGKGRGGGTRAQEVLVWALQDPVVNVRYMSATALGQVGDAKGLEALEQRLDEGDTWYVVQHLWSARRNLMRRLAK
ncbi:HEAT repeat domain-containing protein, partial [Thermodesulfobacteriota bacterium]